MRISFHLRHGIVNLFLRDDLAAVVQIKMPWNRPLFSERYGYRRPKLCLFGFRLFVRPRMTMTITKTG